MNFDDNMYGAFFLQFCSEIGQRISQHFSINYAGTSRELELVFLLQPQIHDFVCDHNYPHHIRITLLHHHQGIIAVVSRSGGLEVGGFNVTLGTKLLHSLSGLTLINYRFINKCSGSLWIKVTESN